MTQHNEYGLLLSFDNDSAEFGRGFEAGRIWAALQTFESGDDEPLTFTVHWSNAEMMLRIGEALSIPVRTTGDPLSVERGESDEVWTEVVFGD